MCFFGRAVKLLIMSHEQAHVNQKQMAHLLDHPSKKVTFAPISPADVYGTQNENGHTEAPSNHHARPTDYLSHLFSSPLFSLFFFSFLPFPFLFFFFFFLNKDQTTFSELRRRNSWLASGNGLFHINIHPLHFLLMTTWGFHGFPLLLLHCRLDGLYMQISYYLLSYICHEVQYI